MLDVPDTTPDTTPDALPIVATPVLLLVQVPPPVLVSVLVVPTHTTGVPPIADGTGLTVNTLVMKHPVDRVYVIVEVPASTPVTTPEAEPTVATLVVLLAHVPPPASVSVAVKPSHATDVPLIADGNGFTVTRVLVKQPVGNV
jgi:hypothetical protein